MGRFQGEIAGLDQHAVAPGAEFQQVKNAGIAREADEPTVVDDAAVAGGGDQVRQDESAICRGIQGNGATDDLQCRPPVSPAHDYLGALDAAVATTLLGHLNLDTTRGYSNPRELQQMGEMQLVVC
jgi:hypothetical protein